MATQTEKPRSSAGRTDTAAVVAGLRQAIFQGDLAPNQRLVEADFCLEYDSRRATVRAALAELTAEGIIERVHNLSARVRAVSVAEAVEIVEVRSSLEGLCAAKAAEAVTEEEVSELQKLGEIMTESVAAGDVGRYSDCNKRLHARLIQISGQHTAAALIDKLLGQTVRYQFRLAMQPGRPSVSLPEHLELINAVCARDPERAAAAMKAHLTSVIGAIRKASETTRPVASDLF